MSEKQLTWADVKAGEWFKSAGGLRYLRCAGGAIRKLGNGVDAVYSNEELKSGSPYQGCHPCSPDFEIVSREEAAKRERGELQIIDERDVALESATNLANRVGEYFGEDVGEHSSINCPITNAFNLLQQSRYQAPNHSDEGEDSAVEDAIQDLIDFCRNGDAVKTTHNIRMWALSRKARDQYERMKEESLDKVLNDAHGLTAAYAVGRDHGRNEQPTIPQEVRECLGHLHIEVCGRGTINITHGDAAHQAIQAALQALDRCEVTKPHPLTKVRELVRFIASNVKDYSAVTFNCDNDSLLIKSLKAARRELQEYDGEVGE